MTQQNRDLINAILLRSIRRVGHSKAVLVFTIYAQPEPYLEVWKCSNCGCDCAGDDASGMCRGCESLTPKQRGEES